MSERFRFCVALYAVLAFSALNPIAMGQTTDADEVIVSAEIAASPSSVSPGSRITLNIKLKLRDGAHANSNMPDDPYLIPTLFKPNKTEGVSWEGIKYPAPTKVVETYSVNPLSVFEDGAEISIQAVIGPDVKGDRITIGGVLRVQACDSEQCYPPKNLPLETSIQLNKKTSSAVDKKEVLATVAPPNTGTLPINSAIDKSIEFEFVDFDGKKRKLSEFRGKYVLLDFWATWCKPCLADIPKLKALYEKYKASGFEILGMDAETLTGDEEEVVDLEFAKEQDERAKQVVKTRGVSWPQAISASALPIAKKVFNVKALPTKILIDKEGREIARIGENDDLTGIVEKLLNDKK